MPKVSWEELTADQFSRNWLLGIPVVVTGVDKVLQGEWTPHDFAKYYGNQKVTVLDCTAPNDLRGTSLTSKTFFSRLADPSSRFTNRRVKVGPPLCFAWDY